jgi:hypothetical protein
MTLLAAGILSVAGCGNVNRDATLGLTTKTIRVPGATADTALEEQLETKGLAGTTVSCAQTIVVHVGVKTTCGLSNAGTNRTVRFTFKNASGEIDSSSVKAQT